MAWSKARPCEDVIGQVLSPFNLTIQSSALPARQPLKLADQLSQALRVRTNYIENIRKSHFLATVLKPYLSAADLAKFWFCQLYTPAGRAFPNIIANMRDLTLPFIFKGCALQEDWSASSTAICVSPRCQCVKQTTTRRRRVMQINGRRKYVPEWVMTSSVNERPGSSAPLLSFAPRFQIVEAEQRTPACLQDKSRFVQAGNTSRCVVHVRTPFAYDKIEQALVNAKQWVANLARGYDSYFGDVGGTDQETRLLRDMAMAFDWSEIVERGNSKPASA